MTSVLDNFRANTTILAIIDMSLSMMSKKVEVIHGYNRFIEEQKKAPGDATITRVLFAAPEYFVSTKPIKEAEDLNGHTYHPGGGGTALLDAIGRAVCGVHPDVRDCIVCIITDGEENSSREWKRDAVRKLIADKTALGWQFIYIGAGPDAFHEGAGLGINPHQIVASQNSPVGLRAASMTMAYAASEYRASKSKMFLKAELQDVQNSAEED